MSYIIVGLGNPGDEYEYTRHNTGRMIVEWFGKTHGAEWKTDMKLGAHTSKVKIGKITVMLVLPDTFMNNSGRALKPLVGSVKVAEKLLVVYDDLDLPFGSIKMSWNKSAGGHKGLESIIKAIKTEKFSRIRVGISPTTPSGKLRKPQGEDSVMKVILGEFKPAELVALKKLSKHISATIETFVASGREKAMNDLN